MGNKDKDTKLKLKLSAILPHLNEKQRRLLIATEANHLGYGGVQRLSKITGVSRPTIYRGKKDLNELENRQDSLNTVRLKGGGRKKITHKSPGIIKAIESLMEASVRGDPESPLRWTCKSVRSLEKVIFPQKSGQFLSSQRLLCLNSFGLKYPKDECILSELYHSM